MSKKAEKITSASAEGEEEFPERLPHLHANMAASATPPPCSHISVFFCTTEMKLQEGDVGEMTRQQTTDAFLEGEVWNGSGECEEWKC
jgi:hypothetical protein